MIRAVKAHGGVRHGAVTIGEGSDLESCWAVFLWALRAPGLR